MNKIRRIAAHEIIIDKKVLRPGVVEIKDSCVFDYYAFTEELPYTEWIGGTIYVRKDENDISHAFHNGRMITSE